MSASWDHRKVAWCYQNCHCSFSSRTDLQLVNQSAWHFSLL